MKKGLIYEPKYYHLEGCPRNPDSSDDEIRKLLLKIIRMLSRKK